MAAPPMIAQDSGHKTPMFRIRLISAGIQSSKARPDTVTTISIIITAS